MATKKTPKPRAIVLISDPHCGSTVGLMPPEFTTLEGVTIKQSPIQKWLWEAWTGFNDWLDNDILKGDPHALVINGDAIEGSHHRSTQIVSADIGDHVEIAIHTLRDRAHKANRAFVVKGTECHTNNTEIVVGKALKLEVNEETGLPAWDRLTIDIAGIRCVFRHHIGTATRRQLRASQLAIHLGEEQLEAVCNGEMPPRVLCCAHRHTYGKWEDEYGLCVTTPAWQGLTRHGHKVVPAARPKPGGVVLDWRDRDDGELPVVHSWVGEAQRPKAVVI